MSILFDNQEATVAQFNSKQLAELFRHLTPTGAQALIDHTAEIELKQLLRRITTLLVPSLEKKTWPNPIDKAQILLALFWVTKDRKYLELAREQAKQYDGGPAGSWTFAIIWQTSKEEEDLANARAIALSLKDDEERMFTLVKVVSDTGDKPLCDALQEVIDKLDSQVSQDKTRLSPHESGLLYRLNGARDTLAIASIQHMGVFDEYLSKKVGQVVLSRLEQFELWLETARITARRQDVDRARSCIVSDHKAGLQFARLAAISQDPKDLEEARRLCGSERGTSVENLLAIATVSRDLADIKEAFSSVATSLTWTILSGGDKFHQACTLVRLMSEKLDEVSKIEVKLPA